MINDNQTNTVYFSSRLKEPKFADFYNNLVAILKKHSIECHFLENTNDIWCRDYMPVQVREDKFVEYRYDPDYLKELKEMPTKSSMVCQSLGLKTTKADIVMDGGNVVKYGSKLIMTDKVFTENPGYSKDELYARLKELFEADTLVMLPWDKKYEPVYGHADGMVRFIDENTVLLENYLATSKSKTAVATRQALTDAGLTIKTLTFNVPKPDEDLNWGYVNFLQMKDILLIPKFGIDEDEQALIQFHRFFPSYSREGRIETIDSREIIECEGVLNCISWNVMG